MTLTCEQWSILALADKSEEPPIASDLAKVPGFHFCPDWDFLAICDASPEADACTCGVLPFPLREAQP